MIMAMAMVINANSKLESCIREDSNLATSERVRMFCHNMLPRSLCRIVPPRRPASAWLTNMDATDPTLENDGSRGWGRRWPDKLGVPTVSGWQVVLPMQR